MNTNILNKIENNAKLTTEELAIFLETSASEISEEIKRMEDDGIICGYHTLINWEKTDRDYVTALIELKVTPVRGLGFDKIAERIYRFDEVKSVYLMSGGYDFMVIIEGKTMKDIAMFVTGKLAPLDSVLSTATHFVLKKYKDHGEVFATTKHDDERMVVSP
ncbi:MAG: Lrp/AsnC family transcriptional regulator [Defluviitaleaceae bacterium]|nr:Lrp/AsnC family transcriptional regulator [Defluviitaleaceae bacterium]MCL2264326.1 Lrp/AsnC family transcriptional regulator [Defluviitaleaceae bacterium]